MLAGKVRFFSLQIYKTIGSTRKLLIGAFTEIFKTVIFNAFKKKTKKKTVYKKSTLTLLKIKINFWNYKTSCIYGIRNFPYEKNWFYCNSRVFCSYLMKTGWLGCRVYYNWRIKLFWSLTLFLLIVLLCYNVQLNK